jgi:hypothetical protein
MKVKISEAIIKEIIREYSDEQENSKNITLYHRISNKTNLNLEDFIMNVINKGLVRYDNGEIGNVIWFSNAYDDYAKNGNFVVSIEYNNKNKEKYQIYYDNHNGYAYEDIPFNDLKVIKIPVFVHNARITDSLTMIKLINDNIATPEKINNLSNVKIYGDIFDSYVQPYINIGDFIKKIETDKISNIL